MSAQKLIFAVGDLTVEIGAAGFPQRVHVQTTDYLQPQDGPGRLTVGGADVDWELLQVQVDVDETEVRHRAAGHPALEYTVRNAFAGGWLQRHLLVNTSTTQIAIDDLLLPVTPAAEQVGWATRTPIMTGWVVQPADGTGPVLSAELSQGKLAGQSAAGFHTGPLRLAPGRRMVLQWRIDLLADTAAVIRRRPAEASWPVELGCAEPFEITDADTAIVAAEPVEVYEENDLQVIVSNRPGRFPVELRSARGSDRIDLTWVPNPDDVIIDNTNRWLAEHRTPAGIGVLPSSGAALGLQQVLTSGLCGVAVEAEDALNLRTAQLLVADRLSIMDLAYLAQESVRTGDREPRIRARQALLEIVEPQPGLGLAGTRLYLAEVIGGDDPSELLSILHRLAQAPVSAAELTGSGQAHLVAAATRLELITVTGAAEPSASGPAWPIARSIGAELGAGLVGTRLGQVEPAILAHAAAVLDLLPEALGPALESLWGMNPHRFAARTRTSALAALLWPPEDRQPGTVGSGASSAPGTGGGAGNASSNPEGDRDQLGELIGWFALGRPIA